MSDTIFGKIVKGEIPAHKVYENDKTLAFLDVYPIQPGHTLVIPKIEAKVVWEMDDKLYIEVMLTAKKVALRLKEVLGVPYIGEQVVGLHVPYAHVQLIPFSTFKQFINQPDMGGEPDHQALSAMAKRLAF